MKAEALPNYSMKSKGSYRDEGLLGRIFDGVLSVWGGTAEQRAFKRVAQDLSRGITQAVVGQTILTFQDSEGFLREVTLGMDRNAILRLFATRDAFYNASKAKGSFWENRANEYLIGVSREVPRNV